MRLQLFGQSGADRFSDNSSQLTQNWHQYTPSGGKSKLSLYPTPGLTLLGDFGTGPIRGEINYNGTYFIVSGSTFYEVTDTGNGIPRGTLATTEGRCSLAHNGANNGQQINIVDGVNGYIWNTQYDTFSELKQYASGLTTASDPEKLTDLNALFITAGVVAGTVVYNSTDLTQATVTNVDSETVLSVSQNIFPASVNYEVGSDAFPKGATHVEFMDGFFLWNDPLNSGRFFKSKAYDGTDIDGSEFATAERSPDELEGLIVANRILWLIGKETAEPWQNIGAQDFPFLPIQSGFSEWGTAAKYSLVEAAGLAFWLSRNEEGDGLIVMANGIQVNIISTPEIAAEIATMSDISDCYSYTYQKFQHTFVVFTFPRGKKTLVYDITEKAFHTWSSKDLGYHRSTGHTFVYNRHLVGDPVNGRIYMLDWDNNTDNGDLIERKRITATFHAEDKGINWDVLEIDIKEGVGDLNTPEPMLYLRYREDDGKWSNYHGRSMGKAGDVGKKVRWRQLGYTSGSRVYEITTSDPVPVVLIDAFARIKVDEAGFR